MTFFFLSISLVVLLILWMRFVEPGRYQLSHHRIHLKKKTGCSFRILHLSDTHFSKSTRAMARFFDRLAKEEIDFVFLTGDVFDCVEGVPFGVENLSKLKPKRGAYAVFGNHDYYNYFLFDILFKGDKPGNLPSTRQPVENFVSALHQSGFRVLNNETVECQLGSCSISIHGLDDFKSQRADYKKIIENFYPAHINILLTHTINVLPVMKKVCPDLALSGHSHGGQIRLPFMGPIITHTRIGRVFVSGVHNYNGTICSVSRGMGASRTFPFRLLCPPEAVLLEVDE